MKTTSTWARIVSFIFLFASTPFLLHAQFEDSGQRLIGVGDAAVAWADYDLDGDLDAVIAGESSRGAITQLYKNTNGSFQAQNNTPFIGITLGDLAFGDFDNDNDPDLLLTGRMSNGSSTTQMYRNDNGTFVDINAGITALSASFADWGDFDNDGDLDFFIAGVGTDGQSVTKIYRNNGSGSFSEVSHSMIGLRRGDGGWIDYDMDGDVDLLISGRDTRDNRWTILYLNDNGSFVDSGIALPQVDLSAVAWGARGIKAPRSLFIAGTSDSGVTSKIYEDTFGSHAPRDELVEHNTFIEGVEFADAAWGDYDNDEGGDLLLMGRTSSGTPVTRVYAAGAGTDIGAGLVGLYKGEAAWGDYDKDGKLDILIAGFDAQDNPVTKIYLNNTANEARIATPSEDMWAIMEGNTVTLNWWVGQNESTDNGHMTYNLRVGTTPGGSEVLAPASLADGTRIIPNAGNGGDGYTYKLVDLPAGTYYWSIQAITANRAGSVFAEEQSFTIGSSTPFSQTSTSIDVTELYAHWIDVDNDGDLDIITSIDIYENQGGSYAAMNSGVSFAREFSDLDNDGDLDILGIVDDEPILYRNDAGIFVPTSIELEFSPAPHFRNFNDPIFSHTQGVSFADVDNDGDEDMVVLKDDGAFYGSGSSHFFRNNNGVLDSLSVHWGPAFYNGTAVFDDFDRDLDLDYFLAGIENSAYKGGGTHLSVNLGDTALVADFPNTVHLGTNSAWADIDNDGDPDLVISGALYDTENPPRLYPHRTIFAINDGGTFTLGQRRFEPLEGVLDWGDFDNDGDPDLLLGDERSFLGFESSGLFISPVFLNQNGQFSNLVNALGQIDFRYTQWGDYDGDGDLDILVVAEENGLFKLRVFENNSVAKNDAPAAPTGLMVAFDDSNTILSWNASSDEETPAAGLTYNLRVGTSSGSSDVMSAHALADGMLLRPSEGNTRQNEAWRLHNLQEGTYYWAVQAVDNGFAGSPFSAEATFTVGGPPPPPPPPPAPDSAFVNSGIALTGVDEGAAAWADYDNDNDLDLLVTGTSNAGPVTKLYRNTSNTLVESGLSFVGLEVSVLSWGDYDGDGDPDFVVTGKDFRSKFRTYLYRNNGASFSVQNSGLPGLIAGAADWGDYDGDGDLDLLLTGRLSNLNNYAAVFENNGGSFSDISAGLQGIRRGESRWVDYDADGDLDIMLTGRIDDVINRRTIIYTNNNGSFSELNDGLPDVDLSSFDWGDVDNDGDPDLLLTGTTGSSKITRLYINNITSFVDSGESFEDVEFSAARFSDYDNDGDLDAFVSGATDAGRLTTVYQNDDGTFVDIESDFVAVSKSAAAWADYDKDGDLDLFVTGQIANDDRVAALYNNLTGDAGASEANDQNTVDLEDGSRLVTSFDSYPNPFNPTTEISYVLNASSQVQLRVFDLTGKMVAHLVNSRQQAGPQRVRFDASHLASGVYITVLETEQAIFTRKLVLVK